MSKTSEILEYLRSKGDWVYGLEITRDLELTTGRLQIATASLERDGYIESKWGELEEPGVPRRRYYKATGKSVPVRIPSSPLSAIRPRFA